MGATGEVCKSELQHARPRHDLHQEVLASYGFDATVDLTVNVLKDAVIRH
jgi:hypothetical protein